MKVELIAWTGVDMPSRIADTKLRERLDGNLTNSLASKEKAADALAEIAGRICYDSFHLPNSDTATNDKYLANIIKQRHESVLEHASATFLVQHVSRSLLTELTRHRHLSFSVRSTRYVDESDASLVLPPALRERLHVSVAPIDSRYAGHGKHRLPELATITVDDELGALIDHASAVYTNLVEFLLSQGLPRKEAREAAREVLPGGIATEFVVTGNHRAWREMLRKRLAPGAAAEIRELAQELLRQLRGIAPNSYQDF